MTVQLNFQPGFHLANADGDKLNRLLDATGAGGAYTVATLPTGAVGDRAYVTDATAPTFGSAVVGGGAVVIPVFKNATVWVVG